MADEAKIIKTLLFHWLKHRHVAVLPVSADVNTTCRKEINPVKQTKKQEDVEDFGSRMRCL